MDLSLKNTFLVKKTLVSTALKLQQQRFVYERLKRQKIQQHNLKIKRINQEEKMHKQNLEELKRL